MALIIERERKKRRLLNLNDTAKCPDTEMDTDTDTEEVKMEKFFAIIRNANDIREELLGIEASKFIKKAMAKTGKDDQKLKSAIVWKTRDFIVKNDVVTAASCSRQEQDNQVQDVGVNVVKDGSFILDLNLSL